MSYPIPRDAFDERLAFVGTSGSGKTYSALGAIEHLLARKSRVVFIDPLGVAWGLRLGLDGKTESPFQPVIFGGAHGDLPLTENAGAIIGEAVATSHDSCIVDLSEFGTAASQRRFMLAFLTAFYKHADRSLVHLVIDESDMFAPQKILDKEGDAQKLLGMVETVVRRGRVRGFIPWLITQRPAVLNKNVLSQTKGLVALNLTGSQDRKAIGDWIETNADKAKEKEVIGSLASKQVGEAVLWVPGLGILEHVKFPPRATYDSSRAPKRGERLSTATLKPLDLGALRSKLATVEAEAHARDPKFLRAEIAKLKAAAKVTPIHSSSVNEKSNVAEIRAAHEQGFAKGYKDGAEAMFDRLWGSVEKFQTGVHGLSDELRRTRAGFPVPVPPKVDLKVNTLIRPKPSTAFTQTVKRSVKPETNGDATLTGPQRQILRSLAWWAAMGHEQITRAQLAAKVGWKVRGGHFVNRLSELARAGLIAYPRDGVVTLTEEGRGVAPEPDVAQTLTDSVRASLTGPQRAIFDALFDLGQEVSRDDLAARVGWETKGGHFVNRLSEMARMEIITYPQKGTVELQEWLRQP